jgi:hypothetical protein
MPAAPFVYTITSKAARAILLEHKVTLETFLQTGQLDLDINTRLTKVGRCKWQIVDFYDAKGSNLKSHLTPQQQQDLPAVQEELAAPTFVASSEDRESHARNWRNLQALRAG